MDKKLAGGAAGLIAAVMYGGSMVFDQEARITALEDIHPELTEAEPEPEAEAEEEAEPEPEVISDEDQIEAEEAEAEAQPPIEAGE